MRIAYFDCETHDLSPVFAPLLCVSVLNEGSGEMRTFRQDDYIRRKKAEDMVDDRALLIDVRDHLNSFHMLSAWHGKGFDLPLLNTRLVMYGEHRIGVRLFLDSMWLFRGWRGLQPKSSKLKDVADFFKLDEQKMEVSAETWLKARGGNRKAMDVAVERCESDVRILKQITDLAFDEGLVRNIERYP